jgi:hypothetical protein
MESMEKLRKLELDLEQVGTPAIGGVVLLQKAIISLLPNEPNRPKLSELFPNLKYKLSLNLLMVATTRLQMKS